jgi:hypothetical protein
MGDLARSGASGGVRIFLFRYNFGKRTDGNGQKKWRLGSENAKPCDELLFVTRIKPCKNGNRAGNWIF